MTVAGTVTAARATAAAWCLFGLAVLCWQFHRFLSVFPSAVMLAIAAELPLLLLGFWLLRLLHPVRVPALAWSVAAAVWGGTAAAGCALLANRGLLSLWAKGAGIRFASDWSASLSAPLNEEILKACGVVMIVLAAPVMIQGPLDGMIYGALVGLGFQVVENVAYGLNNILQSAATDPSRAVLSSMLARVGSTAVGSHWTMTAVAGTGIGYLVWQARGRGGAVPGIACLAGALAMHVLFDAPYLSVPVKATVDLIVFTGLYLVISNAYLGRARQLLTAGIMPGLSPEESAGALSRWQRRRQLRQARPGADRDRLQARQQQILATIDAEAA
jgi:protease PrsW